MINKNFESFEESEIDLVAADWVAKKLKGFTPEEQDLFFDWLSVDPRHSEWYTRHLNTWKKLDLLSQWKPEHSEKPNPDLLKNSESFRRWSWIGGVAAAVLVGLFVLGSEYLIERSSDTYVPQNFVANDYESHVLPDGSVIEMNRGAALKVNYSPEFRRVELVSSEAHFEVAKDKSRPFIVRVRGVDIRAVGTAFNVRLTDSSVELLVTEGIVEMAKLVVGELPDAPLEYAYTEKVLAGQMSIAYFDEAAPPPEVVDVTVEQMDDLLAWKPSLMDFDEVPLGQVIQEFNQRNTIQLEINDHELEAIPIVASFRSPDVYNFVNLLELTMEIQAEHLDDGRIILSKN